MGSLFSLVFALVVIFLLCFPAVKIVQKAGFSGWWVLVWFIPLGNIIALWVFALSDWPALKQPELPSR
jgi:predicted ABC-type exoprotein transport system permease subunit